MANAINQREPLTEKVIGTYELVYASPKIKGHGKVIVTSFGPNETHSLIFNNLTIGTFVNRSGAPQDEGKTYHEKDTLGKGNLLAGAFVLHLLKRMARRKALAARRKLRET
jgi:hypothetical protein